MNKKYKITYIASFIIVLLSVGLSLTSIIINHLPKEAPTPVEPTPIGPTPTPSVKGDIDISGVIFENKEYTYDGNVKKLEAKNVPDTLDYEIKYYINNEEISDAINHGEYKAKLIFKVKNEDLYNKPNDLEANLIINKQVIDINDLTITNEFIFNKEEQKIAISNLPTGITYTESYYDKYNNLVNPFNSGIYRAKINFIINNDNYDIDSEYELILNIYSNLKYKEEEDSASVLGFLSGYNENYINIPAFYNDKPITSIANNAFYESNIYEAIISNNIINIGNQAFSNSSKLMSLTLGDNVSSISNTAFNNCYRLKEVINLSDIALSDTSNIKKYAKDIYENLNYESKIIYGDNSLIYYLKNDELSIINYIGQSKNITVPSTYNDINLTKVEAYALYDLGLESIVLNTGITELGKYSISLNNLERFNLPTTLKIIGDSAFESSLSLTEITLQPSITEIGTGAFKNCKNLETINLNSTAIASISDELFYDCESLSSLILPNTVKSIGCKSFYNASKLEFLNISNVELLESNAFELSGLKTITIPNKITNIPDYAFSESKLESIIIPSTVSTIGECAFEEIKTLTSVTFNNGLQEIKKEAFKDTKITSVILPNSLTILGEGAFSGVEGLASIVLSNKLEKISNDAFKYSSITTIEIPETVTKIGARSFMGCADLEEIVIPSSVKEIGANIFDGCVNLTRVEIKGTIYKTTTNMFGGCEKLEELILPSTLAVFDEYSFTDVNHDIKIYSYANNITISDNNPITRENIYYYRADLESETEPGQYFTIEGGTIKIKII